MKFCIVNSLMPLIMCTKFQINQLIVNPIPVAEKVVKCRTVGNRVKGAQNVEFCFRILFTISETLKAHISGTKTDVNKQ